MHGLTRSAVKPFNRRDSKRDANGRQYYSQLAQAVSSNMGYNKKNIIGNYGILSNGLHLQ